MAVEEEVKRFLKLFADKMNVFDIIFMDNRGKNTQALLDLEITPRYRKEVLLSLESKDYVDGPLPDTLNGENDMWVFGKDVKGREVYIKITMGNENRPVICISFHIAEHPLKYKNK